MEVIDCKGLSCPEPVVLTKKALKKYDEIKVLVDNKVACENITRFSRAMGIEPEITYVESQWTLILRK